MAMNRKLRRIGAAFDDFEGRITINGLCGLQKLKGRLSYSTDVQRVARFNMSDEGNDKCLACLDQMTGLECLVIIRTETSDATLGRLSTLPRLQYLTLAENPHMSDQGISHVGKLRLLKYLVLRLPQISDVGCRCLASLHNLESLEIDASGLSDIGLNALAELGSLRYLDLHHSDALPEPAVRRLQDALPECVVCNL